MNKIKQILVGLTIGILIAFTLSSVFAGLTGPGGGSGPTVPGDLCKVDSDTWAFCNTSDTFGDSSNPIANGEFTILTVGTLNTGTTTISGDIDMGYYKIINIGTTTPSSFTATGGLNLGQDLTVSGTSSMATTTFANVVTGVYPTLSSHLVTKEYADTRGAAIIDYFLTASSSGVGNYYDMRELETGLAESYIASSTIGAGDDQPLFSFISTTTLTQTLKAGSYQGHFHVGKTGTKVATFYWNLYSYTTSSVETLLLTSETQTLVTNATTSFNIHAATSSDMELNSDDRLTVKTFANVGVSGSDVTINLAMEGALDSNVGIVAPSDVFSDIFIRRDGTVGLTGNWDVGGYNITNIGDVTIGTTTNSGVFTVGTNTTMMVIDNNGYVGIGDSSPTTLLDIGTSTEGHITSNHNSLFVSGQLEVDGVADFDGELRARSTLAPYGNMQFATDGSYIGTANTNNYYLMFKAKDTEGALTEVARIQGASDPYFQATNLYSLVSGNVGIGTSTPAYLLDVLGQVKGTDLLSIDSGGDPFVTVGDSGSGGDFGFMRWVSATDALSFGTTIGGTFNDQLIIKESGKIGIGTTTPAYTLDVYGNVNLGSSTASQIIFTGRAGSDLIPLTDSAYDLGTSTAFWRAVYADKVWLTSNTNFYPATYGVVVKANGIDNIYFQNDKTTVYKPIEPNGNGITDLGASNLYWQDTYTIDLYLNSTAYLQGGTAGVIAITGDVGIGTSTPAFTLDVEGTLGVLSTSTLANLDFSGQETDLMIRDNASNSLSVLQAGNNLLNFDTTDSNELITFGADVSLGSLQIDEDSGAVTLVDFPVSDTPAAGVEQSYDFQIDSNSIFTIYSEASGGGTTTDRYVILGSASTTGCIKMRDSDDAGYSWITILDGTISATDTQPVACQ